MIRPVQLRDAAALCTIYNHYVVKTVITFDEEPLTVAEMEARIEETGETLPWYVLAEEGEVVGYAYASRWKGRCAYRFAVESTVYLAPDKTGHGRGSRLYERLLEELPGRGYHTALAGIALPNPASIALHERLGFQPVAHFREVGRKFERWVDVGYWQLLLAG